MLDELMIQTMLLENIYHTLDICLEEIEHHKKKKSYEERLRSIRYNGMVSRADRLITDLIYYQEQISASLDKK